MDNFVDFKADENRVRPVDVAGATFNITRKDPFGYYVISATKGDLPYQLKGDWTSLMAAERALKRFVNG